VTPLQAVRAVPWRKNREGGKGGPIASYSKPLGGGYGLHVYPSGMWSVSGPYVSGVHAIHEQPVPTISGPTVMDLASDMEENVTLAKRAAERWAARHLTEDVLPDVSR
jgi:hypothetical protein